MLIKTKAIVISAVKFQEKSLIVKCLTASDGIKSYFVANAFSGKKNTQKKSLFQPLNLLEIEAYHKNKGNLERFKEVKIAQPFLTVSTQITKATIALFLSEVFHNAIKEEVKNEALYTFLETALLWFDHHEKVVNFHLITLLQITKYLGFYPQQNTSNPYFELSEGIFVSYPTANCLTQGETTLFKTLLQLKYDSSQNLFSAKQRQILLKILIDYYLLNIDSFKKPKSLEVLREVFS